MKKIITNFIIFTMVFSVIGCIKSTPWLGKFSKKIGVIDDIIKKYRFSGDAVIPLQLIPPSADSIGSYLLSIEIKSLLFSCPRNSVLLCSWKQWVPIYAFKKITGYRTDVIPISYEDLSDSEYWAFIDKSLRDIEPKTNLNEFLLELFKRNIPVVVPYRQYFDSHRISYSMPWGYAMRLFPENYDSIKARNLSIMAFASIIVECEKSGNTPSFIGCLESDSTLYDWDIFFNSVFWCIEELDKQNKIDVSDLVVSNIENLLMSRDPLRYLSWRIERELSLGRNPLHWQKLARNELNREIFIGKLYEEYIKSVLSN